MPTIKATNEANEMNQNVPIIVSGPGITLEYLNVRHIAFELAAHCHVSISLFNLSTSLIIVALSIPAPLAPQ